VNLISEKEGNGIVLELKYCERCGGLFLRAQAANLFYCAPCQAHLAVLSSSATPPSNSSTRRRRKARIPVLHAGVEVREGRVQRLHAVAEVGTC